LPAEYCGSVAKPGFPLYFGGEIQGLSRTLKLHFQGPILDEGYSMDCITAIFNICFCDYRTVLVDKKQNMTISKSCVRQNTWQISK